MHHYNIKKCFLGTVLFVFILFTGLPAQAQESPSNKYFPEDAIDGAKLIGPPPEVGTPEFETQMAIVMWLQTSRTPEQVEFVKTSLNLNRYAPILGEELFDVDGTALRQTLAEIINEIRPDYDAIKAQYDIPRPFTINDDVKPPMSARPVASYPSGHATRAVVYARILGEIFPDKKDELMDLGLQIGYGRVISGVHYPMDVVAGQKLGNAYSDVIIETPAFKEALTKIKSE